MHYRIISIILISLSLSGCVPALFGVGAHTQIIATRNQSLTKATKDIAIAHSIRKEFLVNGFKKLYSNINVAVVDCHVQLTGTVENDEDVITAVEIAWNQSGVKEVINEIKVDESSNSMDIGQYTKDAWITTQIKTTILANKDVKFASFTIVTCKNIVYIFGLSTDQRQIEEVANIAASTRGVEQVISNVILKE